MSIRDVVCGWARQHHRHAGNQRFRQVVEWTAPKYVEAKTKVDKTQVIASVVQRIRRESPGGGFVKRDFHSGRWYEIGDDKARDKVGHAIRRVIDEAKKKKKQRKPLQTKKSSSAGAAEDSNKEEEEERQSDQSHPSVLDHHAGKRSAATIAADHGGGVGGSFTVASTTTSSDDIPTSVVFGALGSRGSARLLDQSAVNDHGAASTWWPTDNFNTAAATSETGPGGGITTAGDKSKGSSDHSDSIFINNSSSSFARNDVLSTYAYLQQQQQQQRDRTSTRAAMANGGLVGPSSSFNPYASSSLMMNANEVATPIGPSNHQLIQQNAFLQRAQGFTSQNNQSYPFEDLLPAPLQQSRTMAKKSNDSGIMLAGAAGLSAASLSSQSASPHDMSKDIPSIITSSSSTISLHNHPPTNDAAGRGGDGGNGAGGAGAGRIGANSSTMEALLGWRDGGDSSSSILSSGNHQLLSRTPDAAALSAAGMFRDLPPAVSSSNPSFMPNTMAVGAPGVHNFSHLSSSGSTAMPSATSLLLNSIGNEQYRREMMAMSGISGLAAPASGFQTAVAAATAAASIPNSIAGGGGQLRNFGRYS